MMSSIRTINHLYKIDEFYSRFYRSLLRMNFIHEGARRIFKRRLQIHLLFSQRYRVPRESPVLRINISRQRETRKAGKALIRVYRPAKKGSTDP